MQSKDRLGSNGFEGPLGQHARRAVQTGTGVSLLRGLKEKVHAARQPRSHLFSSQDRRHAQGHGGVHIVAAGVHHAHVLTAPLIGDAAGVGQARLLGHGQGVHVGSPGADATRASAAQQAHHARASDARAHFEPQALQLLCHQSGRTMFAFTELGMLVDIPTPGHGRFQSLTHGDVDEGGEVLLGGGCGRGQAEEQEQGGAHG